MRFGISKNKKTESKDEKKEKDNVNGNKFLIETKFAWPQNSVLTRYSYLHLQESPDFKLDFTPIDHHRENLLGAIVMGDYIYDKKRKSPSLYSGKGYKNLIQFLDKMISYSVQIHQILDQVKIHLEKKTELPEPARPPQKNLRSLIPASTPLFFDSLTPQQNNKTTRLLILYLLSSLQETSYAYEWMNSLSKLSEKESPFQKLTHWQQQLNLPERSAEEHPISYIQRYFYLLITQAEIAIFEVMETSRSELNASIEAALKANDSLIKFMITLLHLAIPDKSVKKDFLESKFKINQHFIEETKKLISQSKSTLKSVLKTVQMGSASISEAKERLIQQLKNYITQDDSTLILFLMVLFDEKNKNENTKTIWPTELDILLSYFKKNDFPLYESIIFKIIHLFYSIQLQIPYHNTLIWEINQHLYLQYAKKLPLAYYKILEKYSQHIEYYRSQVLGKDLTTVFNMLITKQNPSLNTPENLKFKHKISDLLAFIKANMEFIRNFDEQKWPDDISAEFKTISGADRPLSLHHQVITIIGHHMTLINEHIEQLPLTADKKSEAKKLYTEPFVDLLKYSSEVIFKRDPGLLAKIFIVFTHRVSDAKAFDAQAIKVNESAQIIRGNFYKKREQELNAVKSARAQLENIYNRLSDPLNEADKDQFMCEAANYYLRNVDYTLLADDGSEVYLSNEIAKDLWSEDKNRTPLGLQHLVFHLAGAYERTVMWESNFAFTIPIIAQLILTSLITYGLHHALTSEFLLKKESITLTVDELQNQLKKILAKSIADVLEKQNSPNLYYAILMGWLKNTFEIALDEQLSNWSPLFEFFFCKGFIELSKDYSLDSLRRWFFLKKINTIKLPCLTVTQELVSVEVEHRLSYLENRVKPFSLSESDREIKTIITPSGSALIKMVDSSHQQELKMNHPVTDYSSSGLWSITFGEELTHGIIENLQLYIAELLKRYNLLPFGIIESRPDIDHKAIHTLEINELVNNLLDEFWKVYLIFDIKRASSEAQRKIGWIFALPLNTFLKISIATDLLLKMRINTLNLDKLFKIIFEKYLNQLTLNLDLAVQLAKVYICIHCMPLFKEKLPVPRSHEVLTATRVINFLADWQPDLKNIKPDQFLLQIKKISSSLTMIWHLYSEFLLPLRPLQITLIFFEYLLDSSIFLSFQDSTPANHAIQAVADEKSIKVASLMFKPACVPARKPVLSLDHSNNDLFFLP